MQVFTRCPGRDGAQVLLADPWETVWSLKQRLLERHGAPGACADMVRPAAFLVPCQSHLLHSVLVCSSWWTHRQEHTNWQPLLGADECVEPVVAAIHSSQKCL